MIHVLIGTKAQYIKTAPLLWQMDSRGVEYRLIDSGQHAVLAASFQEELGVRPPDLRLGRQSDVTSIPQALVWTTRLAGRLLSRKRIRKTVFDGRDGVCVIHGDTPSTLLGMLMARRAGLAVAQLEAGLRSGKWFHPFPEEIIRYLVARRSHLLFAPDDQAERNLRAMKVRGRIVAAGGNTVLETLRQVTPGGQATGPVIITMHRVENLHRRSRRERMASLAEQLAADRQVLWLLHGPTAGALGKARMDRMDQAGVELSELVGHSEFVQMLAAAPFVITDGGSIQEECAMLGVPTLLWRKHTDRPDGLGANVVLSGYEEAAVRDFIDDPERFRRAVRVPEVTPSERILQVLCE